MCFVLNRGRMLVLKEKFKRNPGFLEYVLLCISCLLILTGLIAFYRFYIREKWTSDSEFSKSNFEEEAKMANIQIPSSLPEQVKEPKLQFAFMGDNVVPYRIYSVHGTPKRRFFMRKLPSEELSQDYVTEDYSH